MIKVLNEKGFLIQEGIYSHEELTELIRLIESKPLKEAFGVRAFLNQYPDIAEKVFNSNLLSIVKKLLPNCDRSIKSIYFDKPPSANWIVNWHQDLTINLTSKKEVKDFINWRELNDRVVVQPLLGILEKIITVRVHLDYCDRTNGALRVIEGSHNKGVIEIKDWVKEAKINETICEVPAGGALIMKPLLLHSSKRTENNKSRRVIHIEFCENILPNRLEWNEAIDVY